MIGDSSEAIKREHIGGNVRFDFPCRPLGWGRLFGLVLVGFGLLFVWMPGHTVWEFFQKLQHENFNVGNLVFTVFPLIFVVAGCVPMGLGLAIIFGRSRIEWRDGDLFCTELVGPFRWTRRLPRKPISKLEVSTGTSQSGTNPPKAMDNFSGITALFADGSRKVIVFGYPKVWAVAVAEELRTYAGGGLGAANPLRVEIVETQPSPLVADPEVTQKPADSLVQLEQRAEGLRLIVPPRGIWKGSMGLFFFAILWNVFMGVFTTIFFLPGTKRDVTIGMFLLIISGFWLVGIGMLVAAINLGRRRAELTVAGNRLSLRTEGIFGVKQREWSRNEITAIRAGASGMEVNNRPVMELQIHPVTGKKFGVLAGRNEQELRWMATELRRVLKVPARIT